MTDFDTIDWSSWIPTVKATLLFIWKGDQLLLIRKKRGLGAGKINAPGGKIDPGETPLQAAERELLEELGVRAEGTVETTVYKGTHLEVYLRTATGQEFLARVDGATVAEAERPAVGDHAVLTFDADAVLVFSEAA